MEARRIHQDLQKISQETLLQWENCDLVFQEKWLLTLKKELLPILDNLQMSEERKSYFLHQAALARSLPELLNLVGLINERQASSPGEQDLIYPSLISGRAVWATMKIQSESIH